MSINIKPKRIQRKRTKGWRMPENTVYVGRPTKWGNPFKIGDFAKIGKGAHLSISYRYLITDKEHATDEYHHLESNNDVVDAFEILTTRYPFNNEWLEELRGKDLACWCPLDKPCHADVLLELANK